MDIGLLSLILVVVLFGLLLCGLWVGFALMAVGLVAMEIALSAPVASVFARRVWGSMNSWDLTALPMFIWMGEILFRSRLSANLFGGLAPFTRRLPGGLLHVNVLGCALFACVSGSSAATTATVGRMSLPELKSRGYDNSLAIGTLAGSGTFGFLIPPSIIMIVYGAATEQSIARLFLAGIGPAILLAILFSGFVMIWASLNRDKLPPPEPAPSWAERGRALGMLLPTVLLIAAVIGSIYAGLASPTEAAVIGVVGSLLIAGLSGGLDRESFVSALRGAAITSCMIAFILAGASFLTIAMGFTGIPRSLASMIGEMGLSPYALIAVLLVFFIIIGCFLDGISIVVLTTSVILPMVLAAGIDPIWFGIFLVLVVEMSQITPPVGFNLFVIQSITGQNIFRIAYYALPFFFLLVLATAIITIFPGIALWLPGTMMSN
ncbi:TRAP transporter, DctM subunit [Aureimonas altamirensis DSM 21988]|uniref:TRAP transporter large permease protein n=2 Tax=Aureimonas altamirensis TaxID=370622 RepID=A0A0P0YXL8_9HYPH|nr:TRAP transporter large permease subunit [Aureimonas altamirensis]BAT26203.1 probable DctM C4-dicarboxylate permease, large subunit [Aureimonas altamirensis]SHJ40679.1 TRAP transporter, DctM subunit [Aureimonas altamirensis DSM 21988]